MAEVRLVAEPRTEFGKGAARRVRRAAKVPAVLYGHGEKPRHVSLPGHELMIALRRDPNALITLEIDGGSELALPRAVVRDPIKGFLEHIDLLLVRSGEKVTIDLALTVVGDTAPGTLLEMQMMSLSVEADATQLPNGLDLDVTGFTSGTQRTAGQVPLPEGTTLVGDPDQLVLSVVGAPSEEEVAAELDAAAAELAPETAEPETPEGEGDVVPDTAGSDGGAAGGPGGASS